MRAKFALPWRKIRDYLRWRGSLNVALLALREFMRPLFYWHRWHIYETDISKEVPEPYGPKDFTIRIYGGGRDFDLPLGMLVSMGELGLDEVASRFTKGHFAVVAFSGKQLGICGSLFRAGYWNEEPKA